MAKTTKPQQVIISRSGGSFTASWKIGDKDYGDGQWMQYRINTGGWVSVGITATTTKKALPISLANFFPYAGKPKLNQIAVRVMGQRKDYKGKKKTIKPKKSDWSYATFNVGTPATTATLTATLSDSVANEATYAWTTSVNDTNGYIFTHVRYQSILVANCTEGNGAKLSWSSSALGWRTGTTGANSSITITEDSSTLANGSYTRWVRTQSRGPHGETGWKYTKHVYSSPIQSRITEASASTTESGGYLCTVRWVSDATNANPIDSTVIQYAFVTPDTGLQCPDGASWTDARTIRDTTGNDGITFSVDSVVGYDQCLFVRVNNKHDGNTTYGSPYMVDVGALKSPTGLSIGDGIDPSTYRATISATNASDVADSFLVVVYKTTEDPDGFPIGIIPHGSNSVVVQCPEYTGQVLFGVYAAVGSYEATTRGDGVGSYAVNAKMTSAEVTQGGTVPVAPSSVTVERTSIEGTVRVTFDWTWTDADKAEISWADHDDAWESTEEPKTFVINSTHASKWNISNLDTGTTWYIRVRLINTSGDDETYGAYSAMQSIDLSSAPAIPVLTVSDGVITEGASITATWSFVSTDGTGQAFAEVAEVVGTTYTPIGQTETAQHLTLTPDWETGETHYLAVRVVSESGRESEGWSEPVAVLVADPLEITITQHSLVEETITVDGESRTVLSLKSMPLTLTVTGAGEGTTIVAIERRETYEMARPDEEDAICFAGETMYLYSQSGEGQITINQDDLFGMLDDEAPYRIVATIQDGLGQSAETTLDFEVHWTHQALMPEAITVSNQAEMITYLTPVAPEGWTAGDVCDIYRLSVDKPQLIYPNATFGMKYVDPFPTIGEYGGHRFVYKTINGDYITEDNKIAWIDTDDTDGDFIYSPYNVIDFGTDRVNLEYNIGLSNAWKKDFQETKYLGGSVQGDWNLGVSRTASLNATVIPDNEETIEGMRRLAIYPGICHVRTKDGSSYAADVQVSETYKDGKVEFSLSITRVDPETYDGVTLAEWEA